ncbi:MAG: class I SAM-dependent methyltransferase, partial [Polyangiaceae bacterium]
AEVADGDRVLDVGSGTGSLSFAVHAATKTAHVIGVDPSRAFIEYATQKSRDSRAEFEVADAQRLSFEDGSFDKTLSMLVMNFIPDRERALEQMIRVTKPDGVVAAAVWDYAGEMQMLRVFWDEAVAFDPAVAPRDEAHMPLCKEGELAALWTKKGLANVEQAPLTIATRFESFDDYWSPFLMGQGPAGAYVTSLSEERRLELEQRLRQRLLGSSADRAIDLRARAWAVKGRVAPR